MFFYKMLLYCTSSAPCLFSVICFFFGHSLSRARGAAPCILFGIFCVGELHLIFADNTINVLLVLVALLLLLALSSHIIIVSLDCVWLKQLQ